MSLQEFQSELDQYCKDDQFSVEDDRIKLHIDRFRRLTLLENLCEAVHPHDLSISREGGTVILTEMGNPIKNKRSPDEFVNQNEYIIDRETFEERYIDEERRRTGGEEIYIAVEDQRVKDLVDVLTSALDSGLYPAGYDLKSKYSRPNVVILAELT